MPILLTPHQELLVTYTSTILRCKHDDSKRNIFQSKNQRIINNGRKAKGEKQMKLSIYILSILIFLTILSGVRAASQNYYAVTAVYFNIPYDASFRISMPSSYTFQSITGVDYATATATSPTWISFNFTSTPQGHLQPYAGGVSGDSQNGATKPIFRYEPIGNTQIKISINLTSIPTGIAVGVNGVCEGPCTNPKTVEQNLTANVEMVLVDSLPLGSKFNCTLWGYAETTASAGQSGPINLYHHSTRV
jgi:hypothetical protein